MRLSATEMQMFRRCRRKWDLQSPNRQNYSPLRPQTALWVGSGIHKGLEQYYRFGDHPAEVFMRWADDEIKQLRAAGKVGDPEIEHELYSARDLGIGMLEHYFSWCVPVDKKSWKKIVAVELPFALRIPKGDGKFGKGILVGKMDMLVQDVKGWLWVVEHKSFAQEPHEQYLALDEQTTLYQYAGQVLVSSGELEGLGIKKTAKVRGVIYNGLRKKRPTEPEVLKSGALSKKASMDTTYEVYLEAIEKNDLIIGDYTDFLDTLKARGNTFFVRQKLDRSVKEMKQLELRLLEIMDDMQKKGLPCYPNPTRDCVWDCAFFGVCLAMNAGGDAKAILKTDFRQAPHRGAAYAKPKQKEAPSGKQKGRKRKDSKT